MSADTGKNVVIIGGGPAGLTAALEILRNTDMKVTLFESEDMLGGISKTINYKGNRIDIGGHRFFSKSETVMKWWNDILPIFEENVPDEKVPEKCMLPVSRKSRILYLRKFFNYPISLSLQTLANLGIFKTVRIGFSYLRIMIFPLKDEKTLENFFINRFGKELYRTFFESYTEKVWGRPCSQISADWGAQRIKGLSISKAVMHFTSSIIKKIPGFSLFASGEVETSLIDSFIYPKLGPGQMWETVGKLIEEKGGSVRMKTEVVKINLDGSKVKEVVVKNSDGTEETIRADYFISSMPVKDLMNSMNPPPPQDALNIASGLVYRDFITVGLLMKKCNLKEKDGSTVKDNWIYIQEPDVRMGRIQFFNNWSRFMVNDPAGTIWLGLEYFVNEGDDLWSMSDKELVDMASAELAKLGITELSDICDGMAYRQKKAYPAYFDTYKDFDKVRKFTDSIDNLYLIGRNGQHRYNNMDHSMLCAIEAARAIKNGSSDRSAIWNVNTEDEYHEGK